MENIFVEFLPPWIETGLQPAFYDKESGTVLQQTARMYARVNMLIRMFNKLSKQTKTEVENFEASTTDTVNEYINKFNELHYYVHDYFDNLDVQEEINNKLDAMVEDGTLEKIINQEIFGDIQQEIAENKKYKSQVIMIATKESNGGDCYIVKFANGKNMFIDTGSRSDWPHIKTSLAALGITKFDYGVITHPHDDHFGNLENFIENFDVSECTFYIPATPDFTKVPDVEAGYTAMYAIFENAGITPVVPVNNSTVSVDSLSKTSIRFLNTDTTWFEDYYDELGEYFTTIVNANAFSVVTEITFENVKFLSVGDIEKCVEDKLVSYLGKQDVITPPHHFTNKHGNWQFWNNIDPDTILLNTSNSSLAYGNKEYEWAISHKKNIISSYQASFDYVIATTYGYNFSYSEANYKAMEYPTLYNNIASLISSVHYAPASEITLDNVKNSMKDGDELNVVVTSDWTQLLADLATFFGVTSIAAGSNLTIIKYGNNDYYIKVLPYNTRLVFEAQKTYTSGYGTCPGTWTTEAELLTMLNNLPVGTYTYKFAGNADLPLGITPSVHRITINEISTSGYRKGVIFGINANTSFATFFGNFTGVAGGFSWKVLSYS